MKLLTFALLFLAFLNDPVKRSAGFFNSPVFVRGAGKISISIREVAC